MTRTQRCTRPEGRALDAMRPVQLELNAQRHAEGSTLIRMGGTHVLVAVSVENGVPPFKRDSGSGWLTAEYAMLPRATHTRSRRDISRGKVPGRSAEIQRLIGRSLRAVVDFEALGERTLTVDCDVLEADGGTRTAAITGAYVAVAQAAASLLLQGDIQRWPLTHQVAAISVGLVDDEARLDLEFVEDQAAQVDLNVVGTGDGELVEVQGTAEGRPFRRSELDTMLELAVTGIDQLLKAQRRALEPVMEEVRELNARHRRTAPPKDEGSLWGPPG
ncbi:MAG: ribonuclease PH [Acidobacteriota bacterium]